MCLCVCACFYVSSYLYWFFDTLLVHYIIYSGILLRLLACILVVCSFVLVAPFVAFSGQQYLRVNVQPTYRSHTNDISLRFKTLKDSGLLFETSNRAADDRLSAMLENGQVKVETNLGGSPRVSKSFVGTAYPFRRGTSPYPGKYLFPAIILCNCCLGRPFKLWLLESF